MSFSTKITLFFSLFIIAACQHSNSADGTNGSNTTSTITVSAYQGTPIIDGAGSDDIWEEIEWANLDQTIDGSSKSEADFKGQYKVTWDENNLYVLVEVTDDSLSDVHPNGLDQFWQDDCLTIFLDQDASGGEHGKSYNAFAYSLGLDGKAVDMTADSTYTYFEDHCVSRRTTRAGVSVWEVAIKIFDGNTYAPDAENIPRMLSQGKKMAIAIAYSDNDGQFERDGLFSNVASGGDKAGLWKQADNFAKLELK
jgi:hypothetical protein